MAAWPRREAHGSVVGTAGEEDGIQAISVASGDAGWLKRCARRWQSGG
jgi:hypothetical protein